MPKWNDKNTEFTLSNEYFLDETVLKGWVKGTKYVFEVLSETEGIYFELTPDQAGNIISALQNFLDQGKLET